jgi:UDP-N-acetylmuramoyl-tripeptide--D-alanyl-D-alanine ligase
VAQGLQRRPRLAHRSTLRSVGPLNVLDDCYNANPLAMEAALATLVSLAAGAPAVAVLGSMLELGPQEQRYHHQLGQQAAGLGLAGLITVGPLAAAIARGALQAGMEAARVHSTEDPREAARLAVRLAGDGGWILVKASRGARLERVLGALEELFQQQ